MISGLTVKLRKALRRVVPQTPRRALALARRRLRDLADGAHLRFAGQGDQPADWPTAIALRQPIRQGPFWQGKLANIRLGCALIDGLELAPGQILSFWALVGEPREERGFAEGRGIRGDQAQGDIGGGLCQLSGLIYELGLRCGLEVIERHPHSRDLYRQESERFTELGLDATVVWPWKDLRLENRTGQTLIFRLEVTDMTVEARCLAKSALVPAELALAREDFQDRREVAVRRGGALVSKDCYRI